MTHPDRTVRADIRLGIRKITDVRVELSVKPRISVTALLYPLVASERSPNVPYIRCSNPNMIRTLAAYKLSSQTFPERSLNVLIYPYGRKFPLNISRMIFTMLRQGPPLPCVLIFFKNF